MFIVIEMQTNGNSTAVLPVTTKETQNEAESVAYTALSAAAISSVEKHTVMVIDDEGAVYLQRCYHHGEEIDGEEQTE